MFGDYKFGLEPPPRGIIFKDGAVNRAFSEPELLPASGLRLGKQEGVYAILIEDWRQSPRPFRVLYFGEAENLWWRATVSHEKHADWQREAGPYARIYRAFHPMPGSTQRERQMVESALITMYNPVCNEKLSFDLGSLLGGFGGFGGWKLGERRDD
jgi:hypothetical protein